MKKALIFLVLALLSAVAPAPASAAHPPVTYTFSGLVIVAAGWLDDGRIWFVAGDYGDRALPYTGTPCPTDVNCVIWGVIDTARDAVVSLSAAPGSWPVRAQQVGTRVFVFARTLDGSPPSDPSALPQPRDSQRRLLVVTPGSDARFISSLPAEFDLFQAVAVGDDVVLAGTAPCPECGPSYEFDRRTRLLRLDAGLAALRYDHVLPGHWLAASHALDDFGRIHFGARGRNLPTSPQAALPWRPTLSDVDQLHSGGVVGVEAATGEVAYASYLHVQTPEYLAWDRNRDSVWVLAATGDQRFPLSADARDTVFCEAGTCALTGCAIFGGQICRIPQEAAILRLSRDGRTILHASYVGGPAADFPRGLYVSSDGPVHVLSVAERLGVSMAGREAGPRQLTVINPETGLHRGPADDANARWTADTTIRARDPRFGDLFGRNAVNVTIPGQDVIHLHPDCAATANQSVRCFSLVWTPHLPSGAFVPEPVPLGRTALVMLALAVALAASIALRHGTKTAA
jgi:hypothetical protein